ncbi:MAG TPA: two-component regulator propeller domain-containing protein [Bryobacteraceae bacterium]|jgi:ligand-binding sensor domain-containing protein/signal transduction histidine kinase
MMLRRVLLPALLVWCAGTGLALDSSRSLTQYVHRIWTTQQGLPSGTIYDIWQTRDGFLWLGTQTGLVRFDGVRFTPAETLYPGLPENLWVRSGFEDAEGALWLGTNDAGVYHVKQGLVTHYSTKDGLPSDQVYCLIPGGSGVAWACTANGLAKLSLSAKAAGDKNGSGAIETRHVSPSTGTDAVRAACLAPDGKLWIGSDAPLVYAGNEAIPLRSIPSDASVRAIACGHSTVWIGTTAGLIELTGSAQTLYTTGNGLADDGILSLDEAADGNLFIGTRGGFSRLRNGEFNSFLPQDGLSQSSVFSLYEDREGSLWAGTKLGLNQFVDGRAIPYTTSEGLPSNAAGPLLQASGGGVWIGTLDAGLARFNGRRFTALGIGEGLASNMVVALAEYKGAIWAGTNRGLTVLENGRVARRFSTADGLPSEEIRTLYADSKGVLWVGTAGGMAKFTGSGFAALKGAHLKDAVVTIGSDRQGRLLFSTEHGLFRLDGGAVQEIAPAGAPLRSVDAIYRDEDGFIWLGTDGQGLQVLDDRGGQLKITTFRVRDGLFDGEIYGIVPDRQGRLWMACSKGIFSVARADFLRVMAGQAKTFSSTPYSPTDASRVIECKPGVQPGILRVSDGQIWFSTIRGLIVIDPEHLKRNVPPPPVVIENPIVNGEVESAESIGGLAPGEKNLEFNYTGLSFLSPTRLTFKYKLEGYDKDWINAGTRRQAFYTNLPPKTFHFRVTACNVADNLCNETGSVVTFRLAPRYYQRVWFWPLMLALAALAGWLGYQVRIRRLRERYDLIVAERSRIARELHDTLIQGFSGITMAMQALAARLRPSEERGRLQDIIQDAATCLRETRRSVAGLRGARATAVSGLSASIAQAARQITETKNVRLKLKLEHEPPNLPAEFEYNLLRIATEAVSNAVKHSGARNIEVTLSAGSQLGGSQPAGSRSTGNGHAWHRSGGRDSRAPETAPTAIFLSVADDGGGCAPSENGHLKPGHYGLIGMKERAAQIGAKFSFESAPGRGTIVSVLAPAPVERSAQMEVVK